MTHIRYFLILLLLFIPVAIWAAINPVDRADWALENVLVIVFIVGLITTIGNVSLIPYLLHLNFYIFITA